MKVTRRKFLQTASSAAVLTTLPKLKKPAEDLNPLSKLRGVVACDTETTGLNPWKGARPFAFSFCDQYGTTAYLDFTVDPFTREVEYQKRKHVFEWLRQFFANEDIVRVFWHAKFDIRMCEFAGLPVRGTFHEGMFAAHACNSDEQSFGLKHLAKKYGNFSDQDQKDLQEAVVKCRRLAKKAKWNIAEDSFGDYWLPAQVWRCGLANPADGKAWRDLCATYATQDAERTMGLWLFYEPQMKKLKVRRVYDKEMELWHVVYAMEDRGVAVSDAETKKLRDAYEAEAAENLKAIRRYQKDINPRSVPQLQKLLYDKLKLTLDPHGFRKKKSPRSTDLDAMMELATKHPIADKILRYKSATKAVSFCDSYDSHKIREGLNQYAIHASFQQCAPKTGRFSCREPNMQQIPSRSTARSPHPIDGRAPFGPRRHCVWYCIDYSQVEVRIFADLSQEETLLGIIKSGQHVHSAITDHVWGGKTEVAFRTAQGALFGTKGTSDDKPEWEKIRKKFWQRDEETTAANWLAHHKYSIVDAEKSLGKKNTVNRTKMMIFNQLYGGGAESLMYLMKCSRAEVMEFVKYFDRRIPRFREWIREVISKARKESCVWTAYGRRIPVDPEFAYKGVNYTVQGSAADLMKHALVSCHKYLRENDVRGWILMTVHDEIVFEFERSENRMKHILEIKRRMEDHGGAFTIPMIAEVDRVKKRWSEKERVKWAE